MSGMIRLKMAGAAIIKALMAEHDAAFGGEHSGHYYFRDFWRVGTGMLTALHVPAALGQQERPMSELTTGFTRAGSRPAQSPHM